MLTEERSLLRIRTEISIDMWRKNEETEKFLNRLHPSFVRGLYTIEQGLSDRRRPCGSKY